MKDYVIAALLNGLEFALSMKSLIGVALLDLLVHALNGVALHILWGMFIVPGFGVPALHVVVATGISLIFHLLVPLQRSPDQNAIDWRLAQLLTPIVSLIFGLIFSMFVGVGGGA